MSRTYNIFPAALPNLQTLATLDQPGTNCSDIDLEGTRMREWMAAVDNYILAIATAIGITNSTDVSSITYKLAHIITPDIPRMQIYSNGAWGSAGLTTRPKIFDKKLGNPEPTRGTNDIIIRRADE